MKKVFVIVVTYNGKKWIDACFGNLFKSYIPLEIIAIDNASTDGTPQIIKEKFPKVEVIEYGKNLGFGQANNFGVQKALDYGADYVFLLNQDAWVGSDSIKKIIDVSATYPEYGIISPVHLNGSGTAFDYKFFNYLYFSRNKSFFSDLFIKKNEDLDKIYELDFINAAFWVIPKKTINDVGGFNPFFFHYGEDNEYINRCVFHGYKIGFVPSAIGYHDRENTHNNHNYLNNVKRDIEIGLLNPNEDYSLTKGFLLLIKTYVEKKITQKRVSFRHLIRIIFKLLSRRNEMRKLKERTKRKGLSFLP